MTAKRGEKQAARDVQALTGRSYQSSLTLVRSWTAAGLRWDAEIAKIAAVQNDREDEP